MLSVATRTTMAAHRRAYDHRLRDMVCEEGTSRMFAPTLVPRATAASWRRRGPRAVVTLDAVTKDMAALQVEVISLRHRNEVLLAITRLYMLLVRLAGVRLDDTRLPDGGTKHKVLTAIARAQASIPLAVALRVVGLSSSRFHAWSRPERLCLLDDRSSCPKTAPTQLTAVVHPATPKEGLRATPPNEYWHIDVTVIRLLDGTCVYLHVAIDNFSRRILSWKVAARLEPQTTCASLVEASKGLRVVPQPPTVVADSGVENVNGEVDALLALGSLRRVLAQVEVTFSNSMIEAWWRFLKHSWLFLNTLDSLAAVERLIAFYVVEHNTVIPHSAFLGQTPDEIYSGTGGAVPEELIAARQSARDARLAANRALSCGSCPPTAAFPPTPESLGIAPVLQLHTPESRMS